MSDQISRRMVLRALSGAGVLASGLYGCGKSDNAVTAGASGPTAATVCADPDAMNESQLNARTSLEYTERSPVPDQVCGTCAFYHADQGQCGTCDMFSGGPVNQQGHCKSWSRKT